MASIQANLDRLVNSLQAVEDHAICLRLEDTGTHYRAYLTPGFKFTAIQAQHQGVGTNRIVAAERLLDRLEKVWNDEY